MLADLLAREAPDILRFSSVTVDRHTAKSIDKFNNAASARVLYRGSLSAYSRNAILPFSSCQTIHKISDIRGAAFDESLSIGEDVKWNLQLACVYADRQFVSTDLNAFKYVLRKNSAVNKTDAESNRRHLDSYLRLYSWLKDSDIASASPFLKKSLDYFTTSTLDKLVTRLLSCNLPCKDNARYASLINQRIAEAGGSGSKIVRVFKILSASPVVLRLAQICYMRLFLPYIKPLLSRN